jgi:uncharacterized protein (TIGR04255 family)
MTTVEHLRKAPITEALVDYRAELPEAFDVSSLRTIGQRLGDDYPTCDERRSVATRLKMSDQGPTSETIDQGIDGFFFRSADGRRVAQFRTDGFSFSLLNPYTTWHHLESEAARLWQLYVELGTPLMVTRLATRYINHIRLPPGATEILDYLTAPPVVPDNAPPLVSAFLSRVTVKDVDTGLAAHITHALEKAPEGEDGLVIILDIDAFKQVSCSSDSGEIETTFDLLHDLKNTLFFGCITEKAKEMFK